MNSAPYKVEYHIIHELAMISSGSVNIPTMETTKDTANRPQQLSLNHNNSLVVDYNCNELSLQQLNGVQLNDAQSRVELPDRFKYGVDDETRSIGDRHQDMSTALQWIRQEIVSIFHYYLSIFHSQEKDWMWHRA